MRELLKRAGLWRGEGGTNHAFRHSFEGEFVDNGGNEMIADLLIGHAQKGMRGRYFHQVNRQFMEAAFRYAPRRFLQLQLDLANGAKAAS
jgi:integrase